MSAPRKGPSLLEDKHADRIKMHIVPLVDTNLFLDLTGWISSPLGSSPLNTEGSPTLDGVHFPHGPFSSVSYKDFCPPSRPDHIAASTAFPRLWYTRKVSHALCKWHHRSLLRINNKVEFSERTNENDACVAMCFSHGGEEGPQPEGLALPLYLGPLCLRSSIHFLGLP